MDRMFLENNPYLKKCVLSSIMISVFVNYYLKKNHKLYNIGYSYFISCKVSFRQPKKGQCFFCTHFFYRCILCDSEHLLF